MIQCDILSDHVLKSLCKKRNKNKWPKTASQWDYSLSGGQPVDNKKRIKEAFWTRIYILKILFYIFQNIFRTLGKYFGFGKFFNNKKTMVLNL